MFVAHIALLAPSYLVPLLLHQPKAQPLENTYKMEPDRKFEVAPVEKLINEVLKQQV